MNMAKYRCEECGKEITVDAKAGIPECCNEKMKQLPLDVCNAPHDAETHRARNSDEACDDGVR